MDNKDIFMWSISAETPRSAFTDIKFVLRTANIFFFIFSKNVEYSGATQNAYSVNHEFLFLVQN